MHRWLVAAALLAALVPALVPSLASGGPRRHPPAAPGGLYGLAAKGPLTPVCQQDVPCWGPAEHAKLVFLQRGRIVASTRTRAGGLYRIDLPPGRYSVKSKIGFGVVKPSPVTVTRVFTRANLLLDTGIR